MWLRSALIIAMLAGLAVIATSHFVVRPRVQKILERSQNEARSRAVAEAARNSALNELSAAKAQSQQTERALTEASAQLTEARNDRDDTARKAAALKETLVATQAKYAETSQKLARWESIPLDPSQVNQLLSANKSQSATNDLLRQELKTALLENARLQQVFENSDPPIDPILPAGLKAKVVTVDPKWNFVVLDVGKKQGALVNGVLMISRNAKLVAKVRIANLEAERCIANILPGWNLAEVMEGDQALY